MKFPRFGILVLLFVFSFFPGLATRQLFGQTLKADYQFSNTRSSSIAGAPDLTNLGPGVNGFLTDNVHSIIQPVLHFPLGNGLRLTPSSGVIPNNVYTIAILFKMDAGGYRRILDFKNGTGDQGLYIEEHNHLQFFIIGINAPTGSTAIFPNNYVQAVLTRDAAGTVTGYVNGIQQFQFDDSTFQVAVIDANSALRFFRDNESGGSTTEHAAGSAARIRLYDGALSAEQVAALYPISILGRAGSTIVAAGSNGVIDPGETVTVSLAVQNVGGPGTVCTTSATTGTLQATGGVTNPSPVSQNYGVLCSNGSPVYREFTFRVNPDLECGAPVIASLVLTDGVTIYETLSLAFVTGTAVLTFSQNFDDVTAPVLPSGWVATNASGPAPPWVTSTTMPDAVPNAVFVDDPAEVSDKRLDTPPILITTALAQVSFRNTYNLEDSYDGGVLEVSSPNIFGGNFTDITDPAVGGSFVAGGYNARISAAFENPLAARMAWTGTSTGGYITTVANLGPNVAGRMIRLRFRLGSDYAVTRPGWRVDTIVVTEERACVPTLLVTTVNDHNDGVCDAADCTLREAINTANARNFSTIGTAPGVSGTIQLSAALPSLNTAIALQGPGANLLAVRRNLGGSYPVFNVLSTAAVTLSGFTIANGQVVGGDGGGIFNSGYLALTDCSVAGNFANASGGVGGNGGGIYNATGATLTLLRSTLVNNNASQFGGAIYNDAKLSATNCTLSNNAAFRGGGIISRYASGASSSILRNCTIASCTATSTGGGNSDGGGGFYAEGGPEQIHIGNTIIANNSNTLNPDVRGQFTSDGHNFIGSEGISSLGFTNGVNGDQVGLNGTPLDPQLAALGNYGGPTQTRALLAASTARDAGDDLLAPPVDQRRFLRVGVSDIGAFEFGGSELPTPTPTPTATATPTATPTPISVSGTVTYCSNPSLNPVPGVTMTLTGASSGSTLSDGSGNYAFTTLAAGGSYTVTPSLAARTPGSAGINTIDVVATQRHFLNLGIPLSGCRLMAADVNTDNAVNTVDVIAVQRFFLSMTTGIAQVGKYKFTPPDRAYPAVASDQTAQNYNTLILGDVASSFVHRSDGTSQAR